MNLPNYNDVLSIITIIFGIFISFETIRRLRSETKKEGSEAVQVITEATVSILNIYKDQHAALKCDIESLRLALESQKALSLERDTKINSLEKKLFDQRGVIIKLIEGVKVLSSQIRMKGGDPLFKLEDANIADFMEDKYE